MSTKAQQRVAIAKDALKWIKAGALIPESGTYIHPKYVGVYKARHETQLRDMKLGKCEVCMIGALFLAKAVRFDRVTVGDYATSNYWEKLEEHFTEDQLNLIESFFEGWADDPKHGIVGAVGFRDNHRDDSERMTLILQNIIENDGTFVPAQLQVQHDTDQSSFPTTSAVEV